MAYPVLTGAVLIEANGAALNNAGQDQGVRADNAIVVKQIRIGASATLTFRDRRGGDGGERCSMRISVGRPAR